MILFLGFRVKFTSKFINTQPGQFASSDPSSQSGSSSQNHDSEIHCPFAHFAIPPQSPDSGASSWCL